MGGTAFKRFKDRKGTVAVMAAIVTTALLGFTACAVDVGMVITSRNQLQNAVDSAALAAASKLDVVNNATAISTAKEYASYNKVLNQTVVLQDSDIQIFDNPDKALRHVRVTAYRTSARGNPINLLFARVLGYNSVDMTASSKAGLIPVSGTNGIRPWAVRDKCLESEGGNDNQNQNGNQNQNNNSNQNSNGNANQNANENENGNADENQNGNENNDENNNQDENGNDNQNQNNNGNEDGNQNGNGNANQNGNENDNENQNQNNNGNQNQNNNNNQNNNQNNNGNGDSNQNQNQNGNGNSNENANQNGNENNNGNQNQNQNGNQNGNCDGNSNQNNNQNQNGNENNNGNQNQNQNGNQNGDENNNGNQNNNSNQNNNQNGNENGNGNGNVNENNNGNGNNQNGNGNDNDNENSDEEATPCTSYEYPAVGELVTLKFGAHDEREEPYWFGPVDMPPVNKGTPQPGADAYRDLIMNGYNGSVEIGDVLRVEPGNMAGPTYQGVNYLIGLDSAAYWDTFNNQVAGSAYPDNQSPRIIKIVFYDPNIGIVGNPGEITVTRIGAFFLEGAMDEPNASVTGRFIETVSTGELDMNSQSRVFGIGLTE